MVFKLPIDVFQWGGIRWKSIVIFFKILSLTQVINVERCVFGEWWTENNLEGRRASLIQTQFRNLLGETDTHHESSHLPQLRLNSEIARLQLQRFAAKETGSEDESRTAIVELERSRTKISLSFISSRCCPRRALQRLRMADRILVQKVRYPG